MKFKYFTIYLTKKFEKLGVCVAEYPSYFIIIPVFLSALLGTGLQKWYDESNIKYLLAPANTRHIEEEATIGKLFPMNLSFNANMERMNREPSVATVLITAKDGGSVLRQHIFQEIVQLDKLIQNISIIYTKTLKYQDLCAKYYGQCFENYILSLDDKIANMMKGNFSIKYPLSVENTYNFYLTSLFLGGVELDRNNNVKSAKAISLYYYLNDESNFQKENAEQWQSMFLETLSFINDKYINVDIYAVIAPGQELRKLLIALLPRMSISIVLIATFSIITCLYNNWIESKPWTGLIALTSSMLTLLSSFGLVMYLDMPFVISAGTIPFLILGIGMDDAFVLLAAWKRTNSAKSVSDRLGEAYTESAISITITSFTNFVAFSSGIFTPYRIVRYFCFYATTSVFFSYIYQMTFVGACMAICGYLEKQNRHSLLFFKLENSKEKQTFFQRVFFTNEFWKSDGDNRENASSIWIKLGNLLSLWPIKLIVLFVLVSHIGIGIYGILQIDFIGKFTDMAALDSCMTRYYEKSFKYFSKYKYRYQIVIDETLNYADTKIQRQVEKIFSDFDNAGIIEDSLTECWLGYYLKFLNDERMFPIVNSYNMSDMKDFITVLRQSFLRHPGGKRFRYDITFNSDYTAIIGSRCLFQSLITEDEDSAVIVLQKLRDITDKVPFKTFTYHSLSFLVDDIDLHAKFTTQLLISISVIVIIICFIFMPNIIITISVTFSVISTEICALGYMALWNVELASVSIIILVMCAGFSVDYSAHLSHAYQENKKGDPNERLRNSINCIGLAIFQGSVTTIMSIVPLAIPLAFSFITAFKIIFLVILFSAINALIFLPVILSTMNIINENLCKKKVLILNKKGNNNINRNINLSFYSSEV